MQEQEVIVQAATTILVRGKAQGGLETYLTKRPDTMRFLPGFYVFPGGTMDKSDQDARFAARCAPIPPEQNPTGLSLDYFITALRETFEEVGILLARDSSGRLLTTEQCQEQRSRLLNKEVSFYDILEQEDLQLATDLLRYFGHRLTPRRLSKRRFETRFFLLVLPEGLEPIPHAGEIAAAGWEDATAALATWSNGEYQMVPPTVKALETLSRYQNPDSLWKSSDGVGTPTAQELE